MNFFEKIRDTGIPITRLNNKFFYTDKIASLLLKLPYNEINQETALVNFLAKGFSKHHLLKLYEKQQKLAVFISNSMAKFKVYDPNSRKYVQLLQIKYGHGSEYLIMGEILEREYGFKFNFTPKQISEDGGKQLCYQIEQVFNRLPDYFRDKNKNTLKAIKRMIKEEQIAIKIENAEE